MKKILSHDERRALRDPLAKKERNVINVNTKWIAKDDKLVQVSTKTPKETEKREKTAPKEHSPINKSSIDEFREFMKRTRGF